MNGKNRYDSLGMEKKMGARLTVEHGRHTKEMST